MGGYNARERRLSCARPAVLVGLRAGPPTSTGVRSSSRAAPGALAIGLLGCRFSPASARHAMGWVEVAHSELVAHVEDQVAGGALVDRGAGGVGYAVHDGECGDNGAGVNCRGFAGSRHKGIAGLLDVAGAALYDGVGKRQKKVAVGDPGVSCRVCDGPGV